MEKIKMELSFSPNTIKWANEKVKSQGIDIKTYLVSKIETEVFREYIEGEFTPIKKYNKNKYKEKKHEKHHYRTNV